MEEQWQVEEDVQGVQKPWETKELKLQEKALLVVSDQTLEGVALSFKTNTGVGAGVFHARIPTDMSGELCQEIVKFVACA